ncbi:MAG: M14 family zinc carboxypeptidase [Candidatus Bathyarchaeia archaeon]
MMGKHKLLGFLLMLKKLSIPILVAILATLILAPTGSGSIYDPYYTKAQKLEMWRNLFNRPDCSIAIVGYTFLGNPIYAFTCGNPQGGRILWDAEIHGSEENAGMILYLLAEWLVKSNSSMAKNILRNSYVMFVPMVNYDSTSRCNSNYTIGRYGVDLNRNFFNGWRKGDPDSDTYPGPYPGSEPETRALRALFQSFNPTFYVNLHVGAGPVILYYRESNSTIAEQVFSTMRSTALSMNVTPYRTIPIGSTGYAIGDAFDLGIPFSCMIEAVGRNEAWIYTDEVYQKLVEIYEPKCRALLIAQSEYFWTADGASEETSGESPTDSTGDSHGEAPHPQNIISGWWSPLTLFAILIAVSISIIALNKYQFRALNGDYPSGICRLKLDSDLQVLSMGYILPVSIRDDILLN